MNRLLSELERLHLLSGGADLDFVQRSDQQLLAWLCLPKHRDLLDCRSRHIVNPTQIAVDEASVARTLLDLALPGLSRLEACDLVAIRHGDEFERWRYALKYGVATAHAIPSLLNPSQGTLRNIRQAVEHEAHLLRHDFGRSKFLSDRKASMRNLGVNAALGTVSGIQYQHSASRRSTAQLISACLRSGTARQPDRRPLTDTLMPS
ncbi:hypothetical protein [Nocardia arthritidis]|uniref:Uncharacterized protein n=1 Tax=Nocardia arthritidis TaxID=228602 RepID=A0A6G9YQQ0_9NOCA|nr:hypothetical protein [Nocardia arthritidis]QIS15635.1 hypothetical protein F5544_39070 [Nocardia arthritidis]